MAHGQLILSGWRTVKETKLTVAHIWITSNIFLIELSGTYPSLNILRSSFTESQLNENPCLTHGSVSLWQCAPDMKMCWWSDAFFMTRVKNCTCLPSIADRISLNVAWNSPMKSCFPFESQSHTVHWSKGYKNEQRRTSKLTYLMY